MKQFQGRGIAKGYDAGRARIRDLNDQNAQQAALNPPAPQVADCYVMRRPRGSQEQWQVFAGPMMKWDAADMAKKKGWAWDGFQYQDSQEAEAVSLDAAGVAEAKAKQESGVAK